VYLLQVVSMSKIIYSRELLHPTPLYVCPGVIGATGHMYKYIVLWVNPKMAREDLCSENCLGEAQEKTYDETVVKL
jgi:hypothetical protein